MTGVVWSNWAVVKPLSFIGPGLLVSQSSREWGEWALGATGADEIVTCLALDSNPGSAGARWPPGEGARTLAP